MWRHCFIIEIATLCSNWLRLNAFHTTSKRLSRTSTTAAMRERIIHLNHAGASPSPSCVIDRVVQHMELEQQLGGYAAAQQAQEEVQQVYADIARLLHATDASEIALVESATVAWTRLFYSMAHYQHENHRNKGKRVILVSEAEYAANVVAACRWAKDHDDWTVVAIPSTIDMTDMNSSSGIVDLDTFREMLAGKFDIHHGQTSRAEFLDPAAIALICVTHVPTNSGIINPVQEIGDIIAQYNKDSSDFPQLFYLVDACQSVGQMNVNVQEIQCHGLTATGRKYLKGPRGTGFLHVDKNVAKHLIPHHVDHACAPVTKVPCKNYNVGAIEEVISMSYKDGAARFEFWESTLANKLGLGRAVKVAMDRGLEEVAQTCNELACTLQDRLKEMPGVRVHHVVKKTQQCGIVTFSIYGMDASIVKQLLWQPLRETRFEVSVVPATSTPLDSATCQVPDLVRASLSYTNTRGEIDEFCNRLESIVLDH